MLAPAPHSENHQCFSDTAVAACAAIPWKCTEDECKPEELDMKLNAYVAAAVYAVYAVGLGSGGVAAAQSGSPPKTNPAGEAKYGDTRMLEAGAKILQSNSPLKGFDVYLNGFHPMKAKPEIQMEAHHYCHQMNEDFAQCVLFDSNTKSANMNGVEYIISEKLFNSLPQEERKYWHPHNGEILSGQLVAPGLPAAAEHALMKKKMNSYGKTWHVWHTGHQGEPGDKMPLGEAMLAWSFNREGEIMPGLGEARDKQLKVSTVEKRERRSDLRALAKPQSGVDDLKGKFPRPTKDIPGVVDQKASGPRASN
ncbi:MULTISPECIES: OBAP family protein [unclassified Massilia]|uniref:OBAP family protein n=1 Tax=unclassified Massilia TaxID=2609279 RepID=UPI001E650B38|nr:MULTISPECIES: OBAP family protein [unclassified Massilia]